MEKGSLCTVIEINALTMNMTVIGRKTLEMAKANAFTIMENSMLANGFKVEEVEMACISTKEVTDTRASGRRICATARELFGLQPPPATLGVLDKTKSTEKEQSTTQKMKFMKKSGIMAFSSLT